ncbi:MAG: hypothetical protein GX049_14845 [Alcaligenaceae bacterium]|nr:hypothetical protein [Alcaligenaceae bacterium]
MKHNDTDQPTRADRALLRQTLWKLTATQKLLCLGVIAAVAFAWLLALERMLAFGRTVDYSGLTMLGAQTTALLQQYNPFFWWALVALCTLIIAYFLKVFVLHTHRQVMARLVSEHTTRKLATELSAPARSVLAWAWQNRREPISVGVIHRAARELRAHRAAKITLVEKQIQWFETGADPDAARRASPALQAAPHHVPANREPGLSHIHSNTPNKA